MTYGNESRIGHPGEAPRAPRTPLVEEIENRQALLRYPTDPQGTLEFLRQRLGLEFQHEPDLPGEEPRLPSGLDPEALRRETLTRRALEAHEGNLDGFEDGALEWLALTPLDPDRRRVLLSRLERPDVPDLPRLVIEDLGAKGSGGFGSLAIHRRLLLPQLDECLKLKPDLLDQGEFLNVYLTRLQPGADANWRQDADEREAYLERLWAFVSRLGPAQNSLKAHVLFHRLAHDRARGIYGPCSLCTDP